MLDSPTRAEGGDNKGICKTGGAQSGYSEGIYGTEQEKKQAIYASKL